MRFVPFVAVGIILASGMVFSQSVDEATSVSHPYTSLTPGALRVDPERTKALIEAAEKTYETLRVLVDAMNATGEGLYPASKRWMELEVSLAKNKEEARKALAHHAARMKSRQKTVEAMKVAGALNEHDLHGARYAAIEAEILLLNAGGKLDD